MNIIFCTSLINRDDCGEMDDGTLVSPSVQFLLHKTDADPQDSFLHISLIVKVGPDQRVQGFKH